MPDTRNFATTHAPEARHAVILLLMHALAIFLIRKFVPLNATTYDIERAHLEKNAVANRSDVIHE